MAEEVGEQNRTEESPSEATRRNAHSGGGTMAENEAIRGESNSALVVMPEYNSERPPIDGRCPICFDRFRLPCRTSCGHWFCSGCILLYWRHLSRLQCKCPMCSALITKLIPESWALTQSSGEAGRILQDIRTYNRLNVSGLLGLFLRALDFPLFIRTRFREDFDHIMWRRIERTIRLISIQLCLLYGYYDFHFFPYGKPGILLLFELLTTVLFFLLVLDGILYKWNTRQRAGR